MHIEATDWFYDALAAGDGGAAIELFDRALDFDARFFFGAFFFTDFAFVFFLSVEERSFLTFSVSLPIRFNNFSIFLFVFDISSLIFFTTHAP